MTRGIKSDGKGKAIPATHLLHEGNISMLYEAGCLRYISAGGYEIIRMIYFAVRDKDWLTITPVISGEKIILKKNGFEIRYKAHYIFKEIDFEGEISIISSPVNRMKLEFQGIANSTFQKNRIGFCILHPVMQWAGNECRITHPDNSFSTDRFPDEISPHQPFKNIRGMRWKINDSMEACLNFEGDIFETEDQRNWTDASFKTYSTPLDQPFPVEVAKDTSIFQRVEFSLEVKGQVGPVKPPVLLKQRQTEITFNVGKPAAVNLPGIGVSVSSRPQPLTMYEAGILKSVHFSHIRGELHLFSGQLEPQYAGLKGESTKAELPAEVCLIFGDNPLAELARFLTLYHKFPVNIVRIIILSENSKVAPADLLSIVIPAIRREFNNIPVGTGTNCNFAQLNRARPGFKDIDFITFAIHPQEHASDERTLIENTAAQQYAVQSASKFEIRKPVIVSPVTIQRRFNANSENYETPVDGKEIPPGVDPRQMSLFGVCWTVGSLKYLIDSDAASITYYESAGERGLFMGEYNSRWPWFFKADKGMVFPVFHIFRMLLDKGKFRVQGSYSTNPLLVDGFAVADGNSGLLFLSNMTRVCNKVFIRGINSYKFIMKMNAGNFEEITRTFQWPDSGDQVKIYPNSDALVLQPFETVILAFDLADLLRI
jgi:D-apionolactonase